MSKYFLFFILFFTSFFLFSINPQSVTAQTITPDPIGDLNISESKTITVTGLDANQTYFWRESKLTQGVLPLATIGSYSPIFTECSTADSKGGMQRNLGPFPQVGFYKIEIYRSYTPLFGSSCKAIGLTDNSIGSVVSKDFTVGGSTGQRCCSALLPVYDRDKDVCKKDVTPNVPVIANNPEAPSECKKAGSYCEPESLYCFNTKTSVKSGKICKNPEDSDFDKDKHIVCVSGGGTPCGTKDNPGISTAIGCIHTEPVALIKDFLKFATAISGGIAFLMMLLGAFQMITSAGNPETLQAGRDRFQSAIIGLLFVIFAVLLLKIIGVDILGLGGQFGIK